MATEKSQRKIAGVLWSCDILFEQKNKKDVIKNSDIQGECSCR